MRYRLAVDVGGTFTDVVAVDQAGRVAFAKAPSTPEDQTEGAMDGIATLASGLGLSTAALLGRVDRLVHGMTVATNALLEGKGARVGLLTTEGHRDVLEMREGLKPERYNLRLPRREPLAPRSRRLPVRERLRADGTVETSLDPTSLAAAIAALRRAEVTSVAVCYLHAYRDPRHEIETARAVREAMPDAHISLSSEVLPQIKEFERVSTTVVNAYVAPLIARYLARFERRLRDEGLSVPLLVILSHGGVAPAAEAARIAAATVLSGPAGGVAGARRVSDALGAPDLLTLDIGGTSSDIALILGGQAALSTDRSMAGERIALPALDIAALGAGGGSIARVGPDGLLRVGPDSAGARPGPICYGRGGTEPTVTDANLVLGLLDAERFAGGAMRLDRDGAVAAFEALGARLGVSALAAAEGVRAVMTAELAEGARLATVRRGIDPRRLALLGFGGAAGLHLVSVARRLGVSRALLPREASVLSAWGMLGAELRTERTQSLVGAVDALDLVEVARVLDALASAERARLASWTDAPVEISRSAEMRYGEQIHDIAAPLDGIDLAGADARQALTRAFEARHRALYNYALPDQAPVLVNLRVAASARDPAPAPAPGAPGSAVAASPIGERRIWIGEPAATAGWRSVPVFAFEALAPGARLDGPAVIDAPSTSVLLEAGDAAVVAETGALDIAVAIGAGDGRE